MDGGAAEIARFIMDEHRSAVFMPASGILTRFG